VNELITAAFARRPDERTPFYLFLDEFQHLVTKDMCEILDGGRKFGLHLILAHQHLNQLKEKDAEVYYSVLTNARLKFLPSRSHPLRKTAMRTKATKTSTSR
jgi:type IV secretory pathway TraG/TraD family ATPase VirD4